VNSPVRQRRRARMPAPGYSDRIHHALAFAAKHNDRQVHKGTRQPYRTHAANVAIILTRYDRDDDTIIAGILQDVVADCVEERFSSEMLEQRIGQKFGSDVLASIIAITLHRVDEAGVDFSHDERRDDLLNRLALADDRARWVAAADALHAVGATLANLRRTIDADSVWSQLPLGREGATKWYRSLCDRLREIGFNEPIVDELSKAVDELRARAAL
jgi:(p)ppGpp synthase/HD superfamily hydrolase